MPNPFQFVTNLRLAVAKRLVGAGQLNPRQERIFAAIMLFVTLLYLIVELGFNARLLDVVGGQASLLEIDRLEKAGRFISGASLSILALAWMLQRGMRAGWSARAYLMRVPLVSAALIGVNFVGQDTLVDHLYNTSTADERSRAVVLVPMTHLMTRQAFGLKGLELTAEDLSTPEGKTFLASFPLLALAVPELTDRLVAQARTMFEFYAEENRGGAETLYREYKAEQKALEQLYANAYVPLNKRFQRGDFGHPSKNRKAAVAAFQQQAQAALGVSTPLNPGLTEAAFLAHPTIQARWREALRLPDKIRLTRGQSLERFEDAVFYPTIEKEAEQHVRERMAKATEYADGGRLEQLGKENYRALIVPPVALVFSLVGVVIHLLKCCGFAMQAFGIGTPARVLAVVVVAVMLGGPLLAPNQVSEQLLFKSLAGHTYERFGPYQGGAIAVGIRWTTQAQPYFYPINEFVRTRILFGLTYGYEGDAPAKSTRI